METSSTASAGGGEQTLIGVELRLGHGCLHTVLWSTDFVDGRETLEVCGMLTMIIGGIQHGGQGLYGLYGNML